MRKTPSCKKCFPDIPFLPCPARWSRKGLLHKPFIRFHSWNGLSCAEDFLHFIRSCRKEETGTGIFPTKTAKSGQNPGRMIREENRHKTDNEKAFFRQSEKTFSTKSSKNVTVVNNHYNQKKTLKVSSVKNNIPF